MAIRMYQRRATDTEWESADPILEGGEIGLDTTSGKIKIGNGSSTWTELPYFIHQYIKTSTDWAITENADSIPKAGQICYDITTGFFKIGNGETQYKNLPDFKDWQTILDDAGVDFDTFKEIQTIVEPLVSAGDTGAILTKNSSALNDESWLNTISYLDSLAFDTAAAATSDIGKVVWNDTDGTLEFGLKGGNVTLQVGQESVIRVKNGHGSTMTNGSVVYITGSTGSNITVDYAQADAEATSASTFAVLTEELSTSGSHGYATTYGIVHNIDTHLLTEGEPIWLSPTEAGGMTSTKPSAPDHMVLVGFCIRSHATEGAIFVKPENAYELAELHSVSLDADASIADNEVLAFDSASSLWKNQTATEANLLEKAEPVFTGTGTGHRIRLTETADVALASTDHAFQAGPTSGPNVRIGDHEIQALNDGAVAQLDVNSLGGTVKIGAGSATAAPLKLTSGTNLTSAEAGAVEYDGTIATITPNTSFGRAPIATPIFTSGIGTSGVAATTNYPLFPAADDTITLPVGTYKVDLSVKMLVATSVVSSAFPFNIRGSGTAVGTFSWDGTASITDTGVANEFNVGSTTITTTSSMALSAASAVANRVYLVRGSGILRVTTAGTIIPSYYWAAAQTSGVVTLYAQNYMMITPLASASVTSTGAWS